MDLRHLILLPFVVLASACGGQSLSTSDEGEAGTGGTGSGGTGTGGTGTGGSGVGGSGVGGATGGTSGTGAGGGGGSGGGNCLALPSCAPDEAQVPEREFCLLDAPCRQVSVCGTTIWCLRKPACDAIPSCDAGDTQLSGPCPPDVSCYTRSACDTTIWCLDNCNPDTEPNRKYLLKECAPGDAWSCSPPTTTSFVNQCGCGCEQDPNCPSVFNCQPAPAAKNAGPESELPDSSNPGAAPVPYCDEAELARCPYSERAF